MTATAASSRIAVLTVPKPDEDPFLDAVRAGVRQMRRSTDLTERQRRLLDDFAKGRYLTGLRMFCEMGRCQTESAADAVALFDQLRGFVLEGHAQDFTIAEAFGLETQSNHDLDHAQWRHAFTPSRGTIDHITEKSSAQEVASRILRDTVLRSRPALVPVR